MKRSQSIVGLVVLMSVGYAQTAMAQVSSDGTVGTIVSPGPVFNITGGTRPSNGPSLFHSFSQFSLPTGSSAIFQNGLAVQTIFSRVTGGSRSDINGLIQTQGNASLFLMNPDGIVFGPNARLQLGGSFVGTTANSIRFEDGIEFSAANLTTNPLLSVKVPIGLQMGQQSGAITVQGVGHNVWHPTILLPAPPNTNPSTLRVNVGQTITLVGNTVNLEQGSLTAPSGTVAIASLSAGQVELNPLSLGWRLGKIDTDQWRDISFSQASLADVSGSPGGTIQLLGRDVTLQDGSTLLNQNIGSQNADRISVRAAGTLAVRGFLPNRDGLIVSETIGPGRGADIDIAAKRIQLSEGGGILSTTFLAGGQGGTISVNATESITANGFLPIDPSRASGIFAVTIFGGGRSGDLSVSSQQLSLYRGAAIDNLVLGGKSGGDLDVKADTIDVIGENEITLGGSTLTATTFFGGDAGKLRVNARRILLQEGGVISSSTLNDGHAGSLSVYASESIQVVGRGRLGSESRIASSAETLPTVFQQTFGLPGVPTGNSGSLTIDSPLIQVQSGGSIKVDNTGMGTAGKLTIAANALQLDQESAITASTRSGQGGNIKLIIQDSLLLRRGSRINATATGSGDGGNIEISSPIMVGFEDSDIIANALKGRGGNIQITTQGIFGLKFRDRLTPDNDITATSEFGISGNVNINTIGITPNSGLVSLPVELKDSSRQIADRCTTAKNSSFVSTGRGGIPQTPMKTSNTDRTWQDLRNTESDRSATTTFIKPIVQSTVPLVEASAIEVDSTGAIALVIPQTIQPNLATCTASRMAS